MGSTPIGISASRSAAVLGLSQFSTPAAVWAEIMESRTPGFCAAHGIEPPPPVDNAAVRWGTAFEDSVIMLAERARGMKISDREKLCTMILKNAEMGPTTANGNEVPVTCHLDGIYSDGVIHEGKTTSAFAYRDAWGEPGTDHIPRAYQVQVAHQMLCSGATSAVVSVLVFPNRADDWEEMGRVLELREVMQGRGAEWCIKWTSPGADAECLTICAAWAEALYEMGYFHQYPIPANPELQALMLDAYRDFWTRYVLTETPPPAETYSDILRLMPEPRGTVVATEDQERHATEYAQISAEISQAKKQQDKLKVLLMGGIERGAEHPIDSDSVEALVLRDRTGKKIASLSKGKEGRITFRCGG